MAELQKHFQMDYNKAKAPYQLESKGNKYRITVLSERLVRLEYSETGSFEDRPTELVLNRNFNVFQFEKKEDNRFLTIKTPYFTLTYEKDKPFFGTKVSPDQNLRIDLNETDKFWYFNHPEVRVFKAPGYSLDNADGNAKYIKSLYSTDGFVSIDDSKSLIYNTDGSLGKRSDTRIDTYVFLYRRDFGACLKDYFTLSGYPALIPRYALGVIWNKNDEYSSKDLENLVFSFYKHKVPLSTIILDDKWHRQFPKMENGFSFDEKLFKKPKRLTDFLHSKNIRLGIKVNPMEGIHHKEDYFFPFQKASGLQGDTKLAFNVFNKNVLSAYFDYLIHPLMNYGVDFFFVGYNNTADLTGLRALTRYHFDDFKQIVNRRGMVMARNTLIAQHRMPITYTGEMLVSWKNLDLLPHYNSCASNIGLSWITNDIGGYKAGLEDGELFTRFVQFGCFSPILRLSADQGEYYKRKPWKWDVTTKSVVTDYLRLRHELIPYIYSEGFRYSKVGLPLIQPLYYGYPEIYDEPLYKNEYYFGSSLLISPITTKKDNLMDRTIQRIFLPDGIWYDFVSGKKFKGGKRYTTFYNSSEYPVFAKAGTIIPMTILDDEDLNNTSCPKKMEIQVFPGKSNTYELYEDDGISSLYEQGYYLLTNIDYTYQKNNVTVVIRPVAGKSGIVPAHRMYRVRFRNIKQPDEVKIHIADETVKGANMYEDDNDFIVELPALSTLKQITINCKGNDIEIDGARLVDEDINSILNDLPIKTKVKEQMGAILLNDEMEVKKKRIEVRKLKKLGVNTKYINLFLKLLEYLEEV